MSNNLVGVIREIVQETMEGLKPTDIAFGTVQLTAPLAIQLESTMQNIPASALQLTSSVILKTVTISGQTVTINEGLAAGDKVTMLRVSKGQRYIVLSKVV